MREFKVVTVVGTRPEIIRLSRVIAKLDESFTHVLVHTGQNYDYELSQVFFDDIGIRKPDYFLEAADGACGPANTIGNVIIRVDDVLADERPDALLVLGDTNSCLSVIPAKRRKIPIFHMEAGNRCFDFRTPEEINRRIVDHVADVNLTYSQIAKDYLMAEGLPPDRVICTGSPMREVVEFQQSKIDASTVLEDLNLKAQNYFLLSAHREENVDNEAKLLCLMNALDEIVNYYDAPVVVSTHPRTKSRLDGLATSINPKIMLMPPFGYSDYLALQKYAIVVLSDSGTISEEASILDFPAINLRDAHERPEAMEEASVVMSSMDAGEIMRSIKLLLDTDGREARKYELVKDYSSSNVSDKVVRILHSYTGYVRRTVWKEY